MKISAAWSVTMMIALSLRTSAQVTVGDNVSMNLNANAGFGYTADYGSTIASDHSINWNGTADLSGSYYSPNFLHFVINPYYNENRANSTSQAITDSSGIDTNVLLFSGSHFPGSVGYSKAWNSVGSFGVPGTANFTTHANSDALDVGWAVNLPEYPTVSVNYTQGKSDYTIYGQSANGNTNFRNLNTHAMYSIAGFNLTGGFTHNQNHSKYPLIETNETQTSQNSGNSFSFGGSHEIGWHGNAGAHFTHSNFSSEFVQSSYSGAVNTVDANVTTHPQGKLTVASFMTYSDNLVGTLWQNAITAGAVVREGIPGQSSSSFDINGLASYNLTQHLLATGTVERRQQSYFGKTYGSNTLTGTTSYWNHLLGGSLSSVLTLTYSMVDSSGVHTLGMLSSLAYFRRVGAWDLNGSANYFQNTQTTLIGYTNSGFGYTGGVGRKVGMVHWHASAGGSKSLISASGYESQTHNYTTGINVKWFGISGSYSQADGTALYGANGIVPNPNPVGLPADIVRYNSHSYGGGVGLNPLKRFTISASLSHAFSDTLNGTQGSHNDTNNGVVRLQYQFRQMWFTAGYSKFKQGFSASTSPPSDINTFYFGAQRWFNFF